MWIYLVMAASALLGTVVSLHPPQSSRSKHIYLGGFVLLAAFGAVITYQQSQETEHEKRNTQQALGNWIVEFSALKQGIIENLTAVRDIKTNQVQELEEKLGVAKENKTLAAKKASIRKKLAKFIEDGELFKKRCLTVKSEDFKKLNAEADQWATNVAIYLQASLDASYRIQFQNPPPGLPLSHPGVPDAHNRLWVGIERHIDVLRKFVAALT